MTAPEAVRKHDGRIVAFDVNRLIGSIARAAAAADPQLHADAARRLANEIAQAAGAFLLTEGKIVPASADIRAMTVKLLRETKHDAIADIYAEYARSASGLLWRLRVVEPGTPFTSPAGTPWDRRRLLESFRMAGVSRDPAGEAAREVERRVVALAQERISPALIHAIAAMALAQRALDVRSYAARRVAVSMATHVPHFDALASDQQPLPQDAVMLEAFWCQSVHSPEIVRAVRENLLGLEPFPNSPADDTSYVDPQAAIDPLLPQIAAALRDWCTRAPRLLWVRADSTERVNEMGRFLSLLPASLTPTPAQAGPLTVLFKLPGAPKQNRLLRRALPVTINVAGLLVREAMRDQHRATICLAKASAVAAQVHREREEYFNLSPVRGRQLPVALAGLWNAAAWMNGENIDAPRVTRATRALAEAFIAVVRGALETLRNETGMELCLIGSAPQAATRQLWRRDREFLQRDGINLDASSAYDGGPTIRLAHNSPDLGERIDFARAASNGFDEPPAVLIEAPFGEEPEAAAWREMFAVLAQAGVARADLLPGGGVRNMRNLSRALRAHLEGFPLLDQLR